MFSCSGVLVLGGWGVYPASADPGWWCARFHREGTTKGDGYMRQWLNFTAVVWYLPLECMQLQTDRLAQRVVRTSP